MNLNEVFCSNGGCPDKHKRGAGNIVSHGRKRPRCKCTTCGRTFSYRRDTAYAGLRTASEVVTQVVTLVSYGCPVAAIVAAFGYDARTVSRWMQRAGQQAEWLHHEQVRPLDLQQVQVDEVRLQMQGLVLWIAMALAVGSRLWLGAVSSVRRDKALAQHIMTCVYNWAQRVPLVISFDGWSAYENACHKVFREPCYTGKSGAPRLRVWGCLTLVQLVKHGKQGIQRLVLSGSCTMLCRILENTQGAGTINTAYIERFFATLRSRLPGFGRRTRCPQRQTEHVMEQVYLMGCIYNFCRYHASLGKRTPAMAAGLTDHLWSISDLLWWRPKPFWASTV